MVFFVAIVREDSLPEGLELEVIEKIEARGMKLSGEASYVYIERNQDSSYEICYLEFAKTFKRRC